MKNTLFINTLFPALEFSASLIFFALPPIFDSPQGVYTVNPYYAMGSLALSVLCSTWFLLSARVAGGAPKPPSLEAARTARYAAACAVLLFLVSLLAWRFSKLTGSVPGAVIRGAWQPDIWFFTNNLAGILVSASFEEIFYRVFLPAKLKYFKIPEYAAYGISLVLFGLGHRPLGLWGVGNALLCGTALQYCYKKTGSVPVICALHTGFNLIGRVLLFFVFPV